MVRSAARRRAQAPRRERRRGLGRRPATVVWLLVGLVGLGLLGIAIAQVGPSHLAGAGREHLLGGIGALLVSTVYTWGVVARSGGRPIVFTGLALVLGVVVLVVDDARLNSGAAVMTAAISAVLAVMSTVAARRTLGAVREALLATVMAGLGAVAVIGWQPQVTVVRFQYAVLVLALVGAFALVYRLGAGLHGLGSRGLVVVVLGAVMLAATLLYADLLRTYGAHGFVHHLSTGTTWLRHKAHGYPRPVEAFLGIPALVWGTHMRSRRRQGWWVCAFGVAATAPIASTLINTQLGVLTDLVSLGYALVVGCVIGVVVIRIDLLLTAGRRSGVPRITGPALVGRRAAREADDTSAVRPEPLRTQALL